MLIVLLAILKFHLVDLLTATHEPTHEPTLEPTTEGSDGGGDLLLINEILVADGRFTTLVKLVIAADLLGAIAGEDPLTVFAPTDDAFEALLKPDGKKEEIVIEADVLRDILLYHVAGGVQELVDGKEIEMLNGDTVLITAVEMEYKVNKSHILESINALNGIIYVSQLLIM